VAADIADHECAAVDRHVFSMIRMRQRFSQVVHVRTPRNAGSAYMTS